MHVICRLRVDPQVREQCEHVPVGVITGKLEPLHCPIKAGRYLEISPGAQCETCRKQPGAIRLNDARLRHSHFRLKQPSIIKSHFTPVIGRHRHAAYQQYGHDSHLALGSCARMTCILQPYLTLTHHCEQVRCWMRSSIGLYEIRQYRTSAAVVSLLASRFSGMIGS